MAATTHRPPTLAARLCLRLRISIPNLEAHPPGCPSSRPIHQTATHHRVSVRADVRRKRPRNWVTGGRKSPSLSTLGRCGLPHAAYLLYCDRHADRIGGRSGCSHKRPLSRATPRQELPPQNSHSLMWRVQCPRTGQAGGHIPAARYLRSCDTSDE